MYNIFMIKCFNTLIFVLLLTSCQSKPTQIWNSSDIFINEKALSIYAKEISSKKVKQDIDFLNFLKV